jgi:hypothetical protein
MAFNSLETGRYPYPPLQGSGHKTRLLTLHPGLEAASIHVELQHVTIEGDNIPDYEALSYVWGSIEDPIPIQVGLEGMHILITRNLFEALIHLRYVEQPRVLWVDAICINQGDMAERNAQVARMGDIYRKARQVVVWLGPEENDSSYAMEWIQLVSSRISSCDWSQAKVVVESPAESPLPTGQRVSMALQDLFHRSWFERLWVWQEIELAEQGLLLCGRHAVPWTSFRDTVGAICFDGAHMQVWDGDQESTFGRRAVFLHGVCHPALWYPTTLQPRIAALRCSDPRDKIYGLLSLLTTADRSLAGIVPDYALTTAQVYEDFALRVLKNCKDGPALLLTCESFGSKLAPGLPSWVPDWSTELVSNERNFGPTRACSNLAQVTGSHTPGSISLGAVRAAAVTRVKIIDSLGPRLAPRDRASASEEDIMAIERELRGLWHLVSDSAVNNDTPHGSRTLLDAFCNVLGGGCFSESHINCPNTHPSLERARDTFERRIIREAALLDTKNPRIDPVSWENWKLFLSYSQQASTRRTLFTTNQGHIGIGSLGMQPGDQPCVFLGLHLPMIVRHVPEMAGYIIVGKSYIPGLNSGEVIFGESPPNTRVVWRYDGDAGSFTTYFLDETSGKMSVKDPKIKKFPIDVSSCEEAWQDCKAEHEGLVNVSIEELQAMGIEAEYLKLV